MDDEIRSKAGVVSAQLKSVTPIEPARADVVPLRVRGSQSLSERLWTAARVGTDVAALTLAVAVTGMAGADGLGLLWTLVIVSVCLLALTSTGQYVPRQRLHMAEELRSAFSVTVLTCIAGAAAVLLLDPSRSGSGDAAIISCLVAGGLVTAGRAGVFAGQRIARRRRRAGSRTLIVGAGKVGTLTASRLLADPGLGLRPIGFLDKEPLALAADADVSELPVLGASWDLERVVAEHEVEQVVIAFSTAPNEVLLDLVRRCWGLRVGVLVVPRLFEVEGVRAEVQRVGALPLVSLRSSDPRGAAVSVKYAIDRTVAAVALLLLAPLLALIALAVLVTAGRPVLFRQKRMGRDGHIFEILKFRTMRGVPEQDGDNNHRWAELTLARAGRDPEAALGSPGDPGDRRTPLGALLRHWSLDELPQLWNVLRGDMSLIGPRPEVAHHAQMFEGAIARYSDRHRVKSGLTGWAQVNGLRGETSLSDRIEWDNFYIENWSIWLDLRILLRTVPILFGQGGESSRGRAASAARAGELTHSAEAVRAGGG
jgi:exopolysaccharide biosynthesis polyprenyl glycosylphosphotransferase